MTKINDTATKEKIDSLTHFSAEAKEKVWELWKILSSEQSLAFWMVPSSDDGWYFHPANTHEPGCTRPPELTPQKMKQDLAYWFFYKSFVRWIQPANLEVLWVDGQTPSLLDYYLDSEISGLKKLLDKARR